MSAGLHGQLATLHLPKLSCIEIILSTGTVNEWQSFLLAHAASLKTIHLTCPCIRLGTWPDILRVLQQLSQLQTLSIMDAIYQGADNQIHDVRFLPCPDPETENILDIQHDIWVVSDVPCCWIWYNRHSRALTGIERWNCQGEEIAAALAMMIEGHRYE